jgi:tetratricopeptide (TPR) repeat protein
VLAGQYVDRNLLDLAEQEFRRIVSHEPEDLAVWQRVLEIIDRRGRKREHVSDFLLVAELMLRRGLLDEAQGLYRKAMQLDPENIEARQSYIELYRKRGQERDLISEYIDLADLLFARGRGAEGRALCQRVLELDASNSQAIHRINRAEAALSTDQVSISGTAADVTRVVRARAADVKVMREGVENYRQMLAAKPDNAMVRKRMADILFQLGEVEEALDEWEHASADFFDHGELEPAITLCEKILNLDPSRSGTRERLSRATVKKDSIAAIESAIESLQDDIFGQESRPPK